MKFSEKLFEKRKRNETKNEHESYIVGLLETVMNNAVDEDGYLRFKELEKKPNMSDYDRKFVYNFKNKINKATISINNLADYKFALEWVTTKEYASDLVAHENAHVNMAESLGMEISDYPYMMTFTDSRNGVKVYPAANVKISIKNDLPIEEKEKIKKVIIAPLEYGNKLSPGDINDLNSLEKTYD